MEKPFQTSTRIAVPPHQVFPLFEEKGRALNLPMEREGDTRLSLTTPRGDVELSGAGDSVLITLGSADRAMLHTLQETIDGNLSRFGMSPQDPWSLGDVGALPANVTIAAVRSCVRISPSYFRVTLYGDELGRFAEGGLHFRLLFAPSGYAGELPSIGQGGRTEWPGGMAAWHRPVYTIRAIDADAGTLEFDVFLHEGGRVTAWCERLGPGTSVALMGPGGEWYPRADWLALYGDETALPAIARILAAAPRQTRGCATILVSHRDDIQELTKPSGIDVEWMVRDAGSTLLERLSAITLPTNDRFVWFAGERAEVASARDILEKKGLEKAELRAASYWKRTT